MLETTPARAARPTRRLKSDDISELDFDWRPQPLERLVTSNRSFRWPIIGAAVVLAAVAIIAVRGLGTISDTQADERLTAYNAEVSAFSAALDALEATLPDIDVQSALAFSVATDDLRLAAAEDLPGLPPFVPQGSLGDVADVQDLLLAIVDVSTTVSADLNLAASYKAASEQLFAVPPLPFSAPEELIEPAGAAIADMQTATLAALAGLEPDARFEMYVGRIEEALDAVPDWADRYLLALRRNNTETAEALIVEITARRQLIEAELGVALDEVSDAVSGRMEELRTALTKADILTKIG
ncbi:MAG: hypothetical protein IH941_10730 [Acidobacteria bacterium]|nr:hypothetical protein [Acidobacteriota bacterium]